MTYGAAGNGLASIVGVAIGAPTTTPGSDAGATAAGGVGEVTTGGAVCGTGEGLLDAGIDAGGDGSVISGVTGGDRVASAASGTGSFPFPALTDDKTVLYVEVIAASCLSAAAKAILAFSAARCNCLAVWDSAAVAVAAGCAFVNC